MQVTVDRGKCVASGQCVLAAEDVFDQDDDDGLVVLLNDHPSAERWADVKQAAGLCPALAITIED
jgi:ferredoxin